MSKPAKPLLWVVEGESVTAELGFRWQLSLVSSRRKEIPEGNLDMNTMLEGGLQQLRGHQEGKTNNTCIKKRGEHKRQVSHGKLLMKNNSKS